MNRPPAAAPADAPLIRVRGLTKRYGRDGPAVLDRLDMEAAAGEKVAVIGPSGSGKSTLLRVLMTLERPDSGEVEIDGEPVWTVRRGGRTRPADEAHLRRMRESLGMVFQQFNLFPHLSVLRNVTLAQQLVRGRSGSESRERALRLLEMVGMADRADAWPAQLSGGQKQRVAIARALALEPRIMLFDEVTSALDPELVGEVLGVLRRLASEGRMTMLVVTHQMDFAREVADRVLFFDHGTVVEQGPPEELLTRPRQARTREFLTAVLEA